MTSDVPLNEERPLRVALLASAMHGGGGLSVGLNMMTALARVAPQNIYFCAAPADAGYEEVVARFAHGELLVHRHRNPLRRWWFESVELPRVVRKLQPDVTFGLGGRALLRPGCAQAIFPQDPHYFYPSRHFGREVLLHRLKSHYHKRYFARQLPYTQLILVQTEVVERRIRDTFGYRGHVMVCSTAVSPFLSPGKTGRPMPEPLHPLRNKLKLFYPAWFNGHKNLERVVELFKRHREALRDVVVITTVAPQQHPSAGRFLREIERHGLSAHLHNVGLIPHRDIGAYYEHCDALFMPTLLETFGIPYLEAMHFDLPILTSDLDFAHATCGDAALFFDPWKPESMRDAILRFRSDPQLRQQLIDAGRRRRHQAFPTWDDIARSVMHSFRTVVAEYRANAGR